MSGLRKICKMYGRMKVGDIEYVWDYHRDKPVPKPEMTKDDFKKSEKAKWLNK